MSNDEDDLAQRRKDEVEFILAAYTRDEAWIVEEEGKCNNSSPLFSSQPKILIVRRLTCNLVATADDDIDDRYSGEQQVVSFFLRLSMPTMYPAEEALCIESVSVDNESCSKTKMTLVNKKTTYNAIPGLTKCCRETAEAYLGMESVLAVLSAADEWLNDYFSKPPGMLGSTPNDRREEEVEEQHPEPLLAVLGRRLIYSHHIISSKKRSDMKKLFQDFQLGGFVKIGWPGLILIEGRELDCQGFYGVIKRWSWQYLVIRGEMQIETANTDASRLFPSDYTEVTDMSIVADHCRQVGLEALFRTSMKVYDSSEDEDKGASSSSIALYGALIHVDHMNDARSYRKNLRKMSNQLDVCLMVKQCCRHRTSNSCLEEGRRVADGAATTASTPTILIVALVGEDASVRAMLKRWRTTRIDVDSRGKPCLERMMTILIEQPLEQRKSLDRIDWEKLCSENCIFITEDELLKVAESIGGKQWVDVLDESVFHNV